MGEKIRYHVRFDPDRYAASAYSLWDNVSNELVAGELNEQSARRVYREYNKKEPS